MFKALARFFSLFSKPKPRVLPKPQYPTYPILDPADTVAEMESRGQATARPVAEEARAAAEQRVAIDTSATPESICGITPDMPQSEISDILARLYQRHNHAASSFDSQLRSEAEFMLDIIAGLREKYLSRPPGE